MTESEAIEKLKKSAPKKPERVISQTKFHRM